MREILFRGKKPITGEWAYGTGLLYDSINTWLADNPSYKAIAFGEKHYQVVPETVGQYTGLTDKNGKKIFEGDILAWNNEEEDDIDGLPFEDELSVVKFCEKRKGYIKKGIDINFVDDFVGFNKNHYRIIGNIHDNPELLKGGD